MKLEIEIADERPEAQILRAVKNPTSYVLELVRADQLKAAKRLSDMPDYATIFADGQNCPSAFKTREEVDAHINHLRDEW